MPRYPEYQIHSLDTQGYGRIIQTIDGKFYDGWGNTITFNIGSNEVNINVEGYETDTTDGGSVNNNNTQVDPFKELQDQINSLKTKLNNETNQLNDQLKRSSYVLPGTIVMWGGSVGGIPTGWALCDGSVLYDESKPLRKQLIDQGNPFGTDSGSPILPDLRERFVVGAGGDNTGIDTPIYNVNDKGGVDKNMLTLKNIPEHEHKFLSSNSFDIKYRNDLDTPSFGGGVQAVRTLDTTYGDWTVTSYNLGENRGIQTTEPNSKKDGPGFTRKTVGNLTDWYPNDPKPIENRPPYFALCFIIKL